MFVTNYGCLFVMIWCIYNELVSIQWVISHDNLLKHPIFIINLFNMFMVSLLCLIDRYYLVITTLLLLDPFTTIFREIV